ncbi:hypothetical protein P3X46_026660 [Hevea brasiliensis]|uniref:C2 domain-containing protein n=1 Tax=Hevea brasiliensis TaxID=3981 RepID=A0ABQ9KYU6_HEVBR|nr:hypothetical protein P3X46_026660 [Hevea brasiliensis]
MKPYALAFVEKDVHVAGTHVDERGSRDRTWNEIVKVSFALNIDIYAYGHVRQKPVGSARVSLCDVLKDGKPDEPADNPIQCMTVQVRRPSGRPLGLLNLWDPPTGRFLLRKESLSFSVKNVLEREEEAVVLDDGDCDGGGGDGDGVQVSARHFGRFSKFVYMYNNKNCVYSKGRGQRDFS